MAIELDPDLNPELVPLAWVIGSWEGVGVVGYPGTPERQFGQRIDFHAPQGAPYLLYTAQSWEFEEDGSLGRTLAVETGIWQLVRQRDAQDAGPGMLVPTDIGRAVNADSVERLRDADGFFELEVEIAHPHGVMELYVGRAKGPRIDLATDVVARTRSAKAYSASKRMYGLVDGELMWAWDMAALGHEIASHASARLKKVA